MNWSAIKTYQSINQSIEICSNMPLHNSNRICFAKFCFSATIDFGTLTNNETPDAAESHNNNFHVFLCYTVYR